MKVTLSQLVLPTEVAMPYVRGKDVNPEIVAQMQDDTKAAEAWPFEEPLEVMVLEEPDPKVYEDPAHPRWAAWAAGARYIVLDGVNRTTVGRSRPDWKLDHEAVIPVTIFEGDERKAFLRQWATNAFHGVKIDPKGRHHALLVMQGTYKMSQAEISKATRLSPASVSRILRGVQTIERPSNKGKGRRGKGKGSKGKRPAWGPEDILVTHFDTVKDLHKHRKALAVFFADHRKHFDAFVKASTSLSEIADLVSIATGVKAEVEGDATV